MQLRQSLTPYGTDKEGAVMNSNQKRNEHIFATGIWLFMCSLPFLCIKFDVSVPLGVYSWLIGLAYFFFQDFQTMTYSQLAATVFYIVQFVLIAVSTVCLLFRKNRGIHIVPLMAIFLELVFQLVCTFSYSEISLQDFISPVLLLTLFVWFLSLRLRTAQ